jgi:hypothetical protein
VSKKKPPATFEPAKSRQVLTGLLTPAQVDELVTQWVEDDHNRLLQLCAHFGVANGPDQWYQLALTLARELYPAPKKKGRTKWTITARMALVVEIERLVRPDDPAYGAAWAAKELVKREPWRSFMKRSDPDPERQAEALRKAYFDFRYDDWARMARGRFTRHKAQDTIAEWDAFVMDAVKNPDSH